MTNHDLQHFAEIATESRIERFFLCPILVLGDVQKIKEFLNKSIILLLLYFTVLLNKFNGNLLLIVFINVLEFQILRLSSLICGSQDVVVIFFDFYFFSFAVFLFLILNFIILCIFSIIEFISVFQLILFVFFCLFAVAL